MGDASVALGVGVDPRPSHRACAPRAGLQGRAGEGAGGSGCRTPSGLWKAVGSAEAFQLNFKTDLGFSQNLWSGSLCMRML